MNRLYRALLRLYPASFRRDYGDEMAAVFEQQLADASGSLGRLGAVARCVD